MWLRYGRSLWKPAAVFADTWSRIRQELLPYMTFRFCLSYALRMLDAEACWGICRNERSGYKEQSLFMSTAEGCWKSFMHGDQSETNRKLEVYSLPLRCAISLSWNQRKLLASPLSGPTRWNISKTTNLPLVLYICETWPVTLIEKFWSSLCENSRSQWSRGPRHEMSSLARSKLWDRGFQSHSSNGWMSAFILLSCVDSGLASGWSPAQGVLPTV
jgi:hypothetical protein